MTEHFFEPGAEYDDATGYSAPETIRTFRCVAVAALPDTGEPVAFGFMYSAALGWGGTGMGIGHWRKGWNRTSPVPEREPSEGLKALAEANEREKARQAVHARPEPDTLPELVSRLREHGLNEAADFFESSKLAELRERAISEGISYKAGSTCAGCSTPAAQQDPDPDDTPWPTLDQEAYLRDREEPEPWKPCPDCMAPSVCEKSDTDLCP